MYCQNCGNKIIENNKFCTNCGTRLINNQTNEINNNIKKDSGLKIASIILGVIGISTVLTFIFAPLGVIISIVGLILAICSSKKEKNSVGIILNIITLILSLIMSILLSLLIINVVDEVNQNKDTWIDEFKYQDDIDIDDYFNDYYSKKFNDIIDKY